jgi:hypothetical protein
VGSGSAGHDVGVDIYRIHRIGNRNFYIFGKNFLDIAVVALGAVADKNFIRGNISPPGLEIMAGNFFPQKFIPLFGTVAPKRFSVGHFVYSPVEGLNAGRGQGAGDITDAQFNHLPLRVRLLKGGGAVFNFSK